MKMEKLAKPTNLAITLLLVAAISNLVHTASSKLEETKMTVYLHNFDRGPNSTVGIVAGLQTLPGENWYFTVFGSLIVNDNPMTETADIESTPVGRAQGFTAVAGLDGINAHAMFTLVFTHGEHEGSTIGLQGISKQFDKVRELPVISGTGKFRYAQGFATLETVFVDEQFIYSIVRLNVTVLHPITSANHL